MEKIRQAVDRVRAGALPPAASGSAPPSTKAATGQSFRRVSLNAAHLEQERIVSHIATDSRTRAFDMLRTQVLQSMDSGGWQFLAITSPTAGCGKTVTAINLALSIARQPERSVLLVDLDLRKPKIAEYLGIGFEHGVMSALEGRATLSDCVVEVGSGPYAMQVLPCEGCAVGSAEWMASQPMTSFLDAVRREFRTHVIIFDLPPLLAGDDVICILPKMDSVLLLGAAGTSKISEVNECAKHLRGANVLRFVLNKATGSANPAYGYGYY